MPHHYQPVDSGIALNDRTKGTPGELSTSPLHGELALPERISLSSDYEKENDYEESAVRLSTSSRYRDDLPEVISAAQAEYAISLLRNIGFYLLPSFLAERWSGDVPSSKKIPATAYLNGVRGIAAFCVFIQHYTNEYYRGAQTNGYHAEPGDVWIVQLPFLRLMYSGGFMVTIFFVISGVVLSYKPLQLVRANDDIVLLNNLASSIFRRGPRLFLPLAPLMLIASTCIYLGLYGLSQHPKEGWLLETTHKWYLGQLLDTWWTFCQVINPFDSAWHWPNTIPPLNTVS